MKNFSDLPPLWTLAAFAVSWLFAQFLPFGKLPSFGVQLLGLAWIVLAVLLILWSVLYFRANKTTIEPHHTPTALITKGPYRISRNPIYLAMVVASIGWALWCGTLSAFVGPVILAWVLHNRFVLPEEAKLREAFGAKAEAYITKTKRWV
jgi:protein-S-isoprenylcysteine O-methyltransferase Ste14